MGGSTASSLNSCNVRADGLASPYRLELTTRHGRDRRVESRHTLRGQIPRHLVDLGGVAVRVVEVGEVETAHAVRLQLNQARPQNRAGEVDRVA